MSEYFILIIVGIAVFLLALSFLKSIIKGILVAVLAVILFRVGWTYSADELFDNLHLRKIIKEEHQGEIYNYYDDYTKKRGSGIIDVESIDNEIKKKEALIKKELEEKEDLIRRDLDEKLKDLKKKP